MQVRILPAHPDIFAVIVQRLVRKSATLFTRVRVPFTAPFSKGKLMATFTDRATGNAVDSSALLGKYYVAYPVLELRNRCFDHPIARGVCVKVFGPGDRLALLNDKGNIQETSVICLVERGSHDPQNDFSEPRLPRS